jgi:hypothetical protein
MAGVERMTADRMRTISSVRAIAPGALYLSWSDGTELTLNVSGLVDVNTDFAAVSVGDWGHSILWPNGIEIGADRLWLETLSTNGHDDARQFLEWRLRNGLSLSKAAEALGLARRTIAYYSNGDRPVPKSILLACCGWEAKEALRHAA